MSELDLSRAEWRKSRRSNGTGGACVEVAAVSRVIAVRDSKNPDGPKLTFTPESWDAFLNGVKRGEHDL
ncbi:MAG: DUF397 domain-containing protein [Streptosporangiales bacterium]|nr:DUF397 domain-containing protein [Streptosporangiales bacterium]